MSRSNQFVSKSPAKRSPEALFEVILDDVIAAASLPIRDWLALAPTPFTPLAIPTDDRREVRVTQIGVDAAHELTAREWAAREDARQTFSRDAFDKISFQAIGRTIADCKKYLPATTNNAEVDDDFYKALAADYAETMERLAGLAGIDVDRHIPCYLFDSDQGVPAFDIGPVAFRPRADWIAAFVKDAKVLAHVQAVESRAIAFSAFREKALADGSDPSERAAWDILATAGNFEWMATVRVVGHDPKQSHHKASIIVGLAVDLIGLRFTRDDASRFGMAGRLNTRWEDRLASRIDGVFLRGWSAQKNGLGDKPGALTAYMAANRPFFDAAGALLTTYMTARQAGAAPGVVERWVNALHWTGEARRETSDAMAVVDYGCAADVLSGAGGEASKMKAFAEAALNPKGTSAPHIADAVRTVYQEGRNKLAHGEASGLFEDLATPRRVGDWLLQALFDVVTPELATWLGSNPAFAALDEKHAIRGFITRLQNRP